MKKANFRMILISVLSFAFALLPVTEPIAAFGQTEDQSDTQAAPPDMPEQFQEVRTKIKDIVDTARAASMAVAVAKDGRIVWEEGFGWADRDKKIKATPHTIYHVASITKSFTATGLMVLVEKGLVDLDKPVNDYLGKAKLTAYAGDPEGATVKRVLFHTAGLPMHWNFYEIDGSGARPDMDESIKRYGILAAAPGETYNYSNFGYGLLGYIITRISGIDYVDFMKEAVFEPLGMSRTSVLIDPNMSDHVAQMYNEYHQPIKPYDFDHRGASAVLSTAHDLARYGMFHLKNKLPDQKAILKDETIDRLHTEIDPQFPDQEESIGFEYLLGSFGAVDLAGYRVNVCTGSMPGASSRLALVPKENLVTVLLCNGDTVDLWEIEKQLIGAFIPGFVETSEKEIESREEKETMSSKPPDSFVGSWSGNMKTNDGEIPIELDMAGTGKVDMTLAGSTAPHLTIETPLGEMGFQTNIFKGIFMGIIGTPDAKRAPHIILVECRVQGDRLIGYAAAVAMNKRFCLPYAIELRREKKDN